MTGNRFGELLRRARGGDDQAWTELVRLYEPAILRAARIQLRDARLRRYFDPVDICQSVFTSMFLRLMSGQLQFGGAEQLMKLLTTMARNKVADRANKEKAERRDYRRTSEDIAAQEALTAPSFEPSQHLSTRELLEGIQRRLSPDERELLEMRQQGHTWKHIAGRLGDQPEALRKKLSRAVNRVAQELQLDV